MKIDILNFLFLGYFAYLPLSALKVIYGTYDHPFQRIRDLTYEEIKNELIILNKHKQIRIKKIDELALKINNFQEDNWNKFENNITSWKEKGISIILYFDNSFPILLKDIPNPPKAIFSIGNIEFKNAISIVGNRNPTDYGIEMANKIGKRFAELGFTIINGFAKGIDTIALQGALEAQGHVIGVLGSGLLNPYPKENLELYTSIINELNGGFISEFLPEDPVKKYYLASRNRISSALTLGSVFIEASEKSGTKWQLKYAKQQKKAIITVKPKGIYSQAELPNHIIKNELQRHIIDKIEDVDDIANKILKEQMNKPKKPKNSGQKTIFDY